MKRLTTALACAMVVFFAASAVAGDGHHKKKQCTADAQTCINKITTKMASASWDGIWVESLEPGKAVVVKNVDEDSPGAKAGIQKGDILATMNGHKLAKLDAKEFHKLMASAKIGDEVTYGIKRDGEFIKTSLVMTAMPQAEAAKMLGWHMMSHAKTEAVASY